MLAGEALGEILLAQDRTEEAVEELSEAVRAMSSVESRWSGLNATRWDLALAEICTGAEDKSGDSRADFRMAMEQLAKVRDDEEELEQRPFSEDRSALEAVALQGRCPRSLDRSPERELSYILREASYGGGPGCAWSGVEVSVADGETSLDGYSLHVWGGGVDERIAVNSEARESVQLNARERSTSRYYFAQLEGEDGEPVSSALPFATHGTLEKDACDHNLVRLIFDRKSSRRENKS